MSRWLSAFRRASLLVILAAVPASPAWAQFYDAARQALDLSTDPIGRSPRLLSLGRFTWIGDDPHYRITLWDFAANPVGVALDDTNSTIDLRPAGATESSVHDNLGFQRQDLAAHEARLGYEFWRRVGATAYGMVGNVGSLRYDQPYSSIVERRTTVSQPSGMPVLAGRLPYTSSGQWLYAVRAIVSTESNVDEFRLFTFTGQGQFIDKDGTTVDPPDAFTPTDFSVQTFGGGAAVAWRPGPSLTASIGADGLNERINGTNHGDRHEAGTSERRPYTLGQATLVGRVGKHFEWGVDGRGWTSASEQRWVFTISAGIGFDPLTGRGKLLDREEKGNALRTRVRWTAGPFELGGGLTTGYRRVGITPPLTSDPTSFNRFLYTVNQRQGADSLVLVDSVSALQSREHAVEGGVGAAWHLRRGLVGVEFHDGRSVLDQTTSGHGPKATSWDVRTGGELEVTPVLAARGGYRYRSYDRDALTAGHKYLSHTMSLGAGVQPVGAHWVLDGGYEVEWFRADFGDPAEPRGSRQQVALQMSWRF